MRFHSKFVLSSTFKNPYLGRLEEPTGNEESREISVEEVILVLENNAEDDDLGRWITPFGI